MAGALFSDGVFTKIITLQGRKTTRIKMAQLLPLLQRDTFLCTSSFSVFCGSSQDSHITIIYFLDFYKTDKSLSAPDILKDLTYFAETFLFSLLFNYSPIESAVARQWNFHLEPRTAVLRSGTNGSTCKATAKEK